ncbi:MAG: metal ABC transporter substrate-binding protein [Candidatus Omnitrophota bacterium]
MKKSWMIFMIVLFGPVIPARAETIHVLTTTADLKSIAEYIGGNRVSVDSLGKGNENYHFLAAKPSYMLKAKKADLFIISGLDLEIGYESLILEGSRNPGIQAGRPGYLDASAGIRPLEVPARVDRSLGDIHPKGNPHYWLDPLNAKIIASTIAGRLSEISPESAAFFQDNLEKFNREIDERMEIWMKALAPYQGEKLISFHLSWTYFADRFGLEVAGELEPKPGVPPSPAHLKEVVDLVKKNNVRIILNENIYREDAARYVADRTGARVVTAPISVGGERDVNDYFSLMDKIVRNVSGGFER